jgi:triosephosphate isomerase
MRRPFVAGNWKMNLLLGQARELMAGLREGLPAPLPIEVAVCPSFVNLMPMNKEVASVPVVLGAQNMAAAERGAYTGETSAEMLNDANCKYVILGHSERRHTIGKGEDDAEINAKVLAALAAEITPILCVGETLEQRDAGETEAVLTGQLAGGLANVTAEQAAGLVIAYEPVWAIGTGRVATPEQAQSAHQHIRGELTSLYGTEAAEAIRIQYGGSVKPDNAEALMVNPDVDGALVGGASLVAADFLGIITATIQAKGL